MSSSPPTGSIDGHGVPGTMPRPGNDVILSVLTGDKNILQIGRFE